VGEYPQKENPDELIHCVLAPEVSSKKNRKDWARLIQKIYEVDPLTCPKCQGRMRILAFIEDDQVIKKILKHLGLWEVKARPPPRVNPSPPNIHIDCSDSQVPTSEDYLYCDPDYPIEAYALRFFHNRL